MNIAFDTLKLAKKLEKSGFSREQATGAAEALSENLSINIDELATKTDVQTAKTDLKTEIQDTKTELQAEIQSTKTELQTEIQATKAEIVDVKKQLKPMQYDIITIKAELGMIKWMMGGTVFGIFLLVIKTFLV